MGNPGIRGGVWPALVTPFDAEGRPDHEAMERLVVRLLEKKVDGFYACGSTGQGLSLTVEERKAVSRTVLRAAGNSVPVLVQVGAAAPGDACALAADAARIGAAGVSSILPPGYADPAAVREYFRAVARAAEGLPLFPYFQGGNVQPLSIMRELADISSLAGTKYTGPNMFELAAIVESGRGPWTVFSGMDEQCVFAAMAGASGNIGSSVNAIPGAYRAMRRAYAAGALEEAMAMQRKGNRVIAALIRFGYGGALREALGFLGVPCGAVRLPDLPLPPSRSAELRRELETAGFFELAAL